MPEDIDPIFADEPLYNQDTTNAINLYWAPDPFNKRSGKTKRCYDIPLVS
jgi:pre-mRNA-processing factor 8